MVQHLMRQYQKYQTICDYAPTISHDMSVIHDVKHYETPMQKLKEIIAEFYSTLPLRRRCFLHDELTMHCERFVTFFEKTTASRKTRSCFYLTIHHFRGLFRKACRGSRS